MDFLEIAVDAPVQDVWARLGSYPNLGEHAIHDESFYGALPQDCGLRAIADFNNGYQVSIFVHDNTDNAQVAVQARHLFDWLAGQTRWRLRLVDESETELAARPALIAV